jgi:hypothetical protein
MNTPSSTPGICRIDQPEKYNHGFFVRLQRNGKIHSTFFSDKNHGGQAQPRDNVLILILLLIAIGFQSRLRLR